MINRRKGRGSSVNNDGPPLSGNGPPSGNGSAHASASASAAAAATTASGSVSSVSSLYNDAEGGYATRREVSMGSPTMGSPAPPRQRRGTIRGRRHSTGGSYSSNPALTLGLAAFSLVAFVATLYFALRSNSHRDMHAEVHNQMKRAEDEIRRLHRENDDLREQQRREAKRVADQLNEINRDKRQAETDRTSLQSRLDRSILAEREAREEARELKKGVEEGREATTRNKDRRDEKLEERYKSLVEHVRRESYRSAVERFGPGPHLVSVQVALPKDANYPAMPLDPTFVIELNPLDKTPHSVHLFLEQVAHGLWDGCTFVINARHIIQAGARPGWQNRGENKMKPFRDMKLDELSYQEYSPEYPHEKYTVGFAGRPGGPDFYINKMNNTQSHGPGGQRHEVLTEEADACFGRVVHGIHVVDRIGTAPANPNNGYTMNQPVVITRMQVLGVEITEPRWRADMGAEKMNITVHGRLVDEDGNRVADEAGGDGGGKLDAGGVPANNEKKQEQGKPQDTGDRPTGARVK